VNFDRKAKGPRVSLDDQEEGLYILIIKRRDVRGPK
jgi:hypothetical protein